MKDIIIKCRTCKKESIVGVIPSNTDFVLELGFCKECIDNSSKKGEIKCEEKIKKNANCVEE